MSSNIAERIREVRERIGAAAEGCGRDPALVKLVAVSKTKSPDEIREAYEAGQRVFGENYAQEMQEKAQALGELDIEWHFIGRLQKNKAKIVAPYASCIETVDSIELAEALNRRATHPLPCLIEVNLGGEETKSGAEPDTIIDLARAILALPNLKLHGLMAIPPCDPNPEESRPYFTSLKAMQSPLNTALGVQLCELSMGMSHDLEVAIEEGATIIRVGTAIFGERTVRECVS